jgi:Ricin-type beta-trefoil lectin domain/Ricin-type beta-trefoil lectin domain-like
MSSWCARYSYGRCKMHRFVLVAGLPLMLVSNMAFGIETKNPVEILAVHSEKCLDVFEASRQERADIVQFPCHGGPNQRWTIKELKPPDVPFGVTGLHHITVLHTGMCMDVFNFSVDNKAKLIQFNCHNGNNQRFIMDSGPPPPPPPPGQSPLPPEEIIFHMRFQIKAVHSSKCLDIDGGTILDLARLIQFDCHGGTNQQFRLIK